MTGRLPASVRLGRVLRTAWLAALLTSLAGMLACLLVMMVVGESFNRGGLTRILALTAIAPVLCATGLVASGVMVRGALASFMLAAMAAALAALVGWMVLMWRATGGGPPPSETTVKLLLTCTIIGGGVPALGAILTSPPRPRPIVVLRTATVASGGVAATAVLLFMWSRWWEAHTEVLAVALAAGLAGALLGGLGLLAAGQWTRLRERRRVESMPARIRLSLECPRCGREQSMASGLGRCRRCGLTLLIDFQEPRCECGYLLYALPGETCPECGREVPVEERWAQTRRTSIRRNGKERLSD